MLGPNFECQFYPNLNMSDPSLFVLVLTRIEVSSKMVFWVWIPYTGDLKTTTTNYQLATRVHDKIRILLNPVVLGP